MWQLQLNELTWLVGLYEGEGYFGMRGATPVVFLKMTDYEVVNKAAGLLNHQRALYTSELPSGKITYALHISGDKAVEIMEMFEPHMCSRNALRIRDILDKRKEWRATKRHRYVSGI